MIHAKTCFHNSLHPPLLKPHEATLHSMAQPGTFKSEFKQKSEHCFLQPNSFISNSFCSRDEHGGSQDATFPSHNGFPDTVNSAKFSNLSNIDGKVLKELFLKSSKYMYLRF